MYVLCLGTHESLDAGQFSLYIDVDKSIKVSEDSGVEYIWIRYDVVA